MGEIKTTKDDGEVYTKVKVMVEIEVFLGYEDDLPEITDAYVKQRFWDMERVDLGESVLNHVNIERDVIRE